MQIVKNIAGIIVGYFVMVLIVVGTLFVTYSLGGPEFAFKPESWEASTWWALVSLVSGTIASVVAGAVCSLISRSQTAITIFAGVILTLGMVSAVVAMQKEKPTDPRPAGIDFVASGQKAYSPNWYNFLIPIIGAAGVFVGGRLIAPKE